MKDLSVVWTKHQEDPHILQVVRAMQLQENLL